MAIDINKLKNNAPLTTARNTKSSGGDVKTQAQTSASNVKTDSVSITSQAKELQSAQAKMSQLPEVDQAKVAEIKMAIAEGRYKVDPEKLAANIASFEAELSELKLAD